MLTGAKSSVLINYQQETSKTITGDLHKKQQNSTHYVRELLRDAVWIHKHSLQKPNLCELYKL